MAARDPARMLSWLALCLFSLALEALAETQPPDRSMQFAVVRGSSSMCEPVCPEWIWAEGEIRADTPKRLKKFLKTLGGRKLPVVIQSPGGDLDAALAMGRTIRTKGLDVAVGYTTFVSCVPRQKDCKPDRTGAYVGVAAAGWAYCNSACPMVLAGGVRRLVGTWAQLGVHQITTTITQQKVLYRTTTRIVKGKKVVSKKIISRKNAGTVVTTKMSRGLRRKITTYLAEMGVSAELVEPINKTAATDIRRLEQVEMLAMKLITSLDQVDALTSPSICKAQPLPLNCREVSAEQDVAGKAQTGKPAVAKQVDAQTVVARQTDAKQVDAEHKVEEAGVAETGKLGLMRFALVRRSDPLCEPACPEWISAEGTITRTTPDRLRRLLDEIGDRRLPIVISSPGGDLPGALAAGRLIRERGLDVAVARTRFSGCTAETEGCATDNGKFVGVAVDAEGECGSSCPLMLAGGVRRLVGPNARLTIRSVALERLVAEYLDEMGFAPAFLRMMQNVGSAGRRLDPEMMRIYELTTNSVSVEALTAPIICNTAPKPKNCRTVQATQ